MKFIESGKTELNVQELMELIPHRYPILMIDQLVDIIQGVGAVGIKNVPIGDKVFEGHFPAKPIMPGVFIIEAMAQTAAAYAAYAENKDLKSQSAMLFGIDKVRFRQAVTPGDQLRVKVYITRKRVSVWKFAGKAYVDGSKVADGSFSAILK